MSKLISAKYDDICMECSSAIKAGSMIIWTGKHNYHKNCYTESPKDFRSKIIKGLMA